MRSAHANMTMKSVCAVSPGCLEVVDDVPMPVIDDYECLVRIIASGFCNGTDLKIIRGKAGTLTVPFPALVGHESVGEVVETGSKVRNWQVGDRMTNPSFRLMPGTRYGKMWGAMSEYGVVRDVEASCEAGFPATAGATRRLPREIDPVGAAVILSLKETLSAVRNFGFRPGMDALVYGDGPMSLALVQFLRLEGAGWIGVIGHWDDRLQRAMDIGRADAVFNSHHGSVRGWLGERRVHLVIDAAGAPEIIMEGAQFLQKGGKVGVTGVLSPGHSTIDLLALPNHTSVHALTFPYREHELHDEMIRLILSGQVNPADYYSHVLPLDRAEEAMDLVTGRKAFKVILKVD